MKVYLDMVGCRLNQAEIEKYANQFRLAGHDLTADPHLADLIVVNTCTVTSAAASDSRQKIRQAFKAGAHQIIVTGCLATVDPQQVLALQGVTQLVDNLKKDDLVPMVLGVDSSIFNGTALRRLPIPGARLRTRAFIKVQDGCDNHCTYCVTRLARGTSRSRSIKAILADITSALQGGAQEIVLTGVHLGSWGYDFPQPSHLASLMRAILDSTCTPRLHLSSIEPWDLTPDFFELWQDARLCRHLHLPLQSGCAATLKRMGRKTTPQAYAKLIHQAHHAIPGVAITTDIITGFPGETLEEFDQSSEFIKQMNFSGGHVFTYSPRPGTSAFGMPDKVPSAVAKVRNAFIRKILHQSATTFRSEYIGQVLSVLVEKATQLDNHLWQLSGFSDNYIRVYATSSTPCWNQILSIHASRMGQDALQGEISPA
jgi:threonylcarbamoyladenosine tRNA methylthiotransferase MtaB